MVIVAKHYHADAALTRQRGAPIIRRMPEQRRSQKRSDDQTEVRFRPVLGISPRTYVPAVYVAIILVILFFVLVFPGIRNNGTQVTFISIPPGASVLVDGTRVGATPVTAFVERGRRSIELRKPFFEPSQNEITFGGRLFGSVLFPRRREITEKLSLVDASALLQDASARFARWALVGRPSAQYQFPLVVAPAMESAIYAGADLPSQVTSDFLLSAAASTQNDTQLRDVIRATALVRQDGGVFGSRQLVSTLQALAQTAEERPAAPFWYAGATSQVADYSTFQQSDYFSTQLQSYSTDLIAETMRNDTAGRRLDVDIITIAGVEMARVPGGTVILGGMQGVDSGIDPFSVPVPRTVPEFYLQRREVSVELYRRFVDAVPRFAPDAREQLVEDGIADDDYLSPFGKRDYLESARADEPVVAVSYGAAQAFAAWLETQLPASLSDRQVRLPTEEEFEWAAVLNAERQEDGWFYSEAVDGQEESAGPRSVTGGTAGRLGIFDLSGNVWEWSEDWYRPAGYPFKRPGRSTPDGMTLPGAMRAVRGGSWANPSDEVGPRVRGAQSPEWSTPYLGFRVVLVRRNGT